MKQLIAILFCLSFFLGKAQDVSDSLFLLQNHLTDTVSQPENIQNKAVFFNGQVTAWSVFQFTNPVNTQLGARFVPALTGFYNFSENTKLDFETSLNINGALNWNGTQFDTTTYAFNPYRFWMRYSGDNWEIRGGLQKINFGSAKMFRPLMWFDEMDVRDPLQLTDGVYGLLGKYFFSNNANIWLWSLIGNKNPKGFEMLGSALWKPEVGGRIETPLGPGELAFSTHFRQTDLQSLFHNTSEKTYLNESRIGLDGKWDVGPGIWFEASVSMFEKSNFPIISFQDMWSLGADYTLPIGSGLNVSAEYFRFHMGNKIWKEGSSANILGGMLTYPLSLIDNVSAMILYVKELESYFNYISFSRTYDNWNLYLIGFWNPETNLPIGGKLGGNNLFKGKGAQLMVSYNF